MNIELLEDDADVAPPPPPPPVMDIILSWIGFDQEATRARIREEGFETFADLATMKEKDIRDLAESYSRRTIADGRAIFGLRRVRYMIGLIHWARMNESGRSGNQPSPTTCLLFLVSTVSRCHTWFVSRMFQTGASTTQVSTRGRLRVPR